MQFWHKVSRILWTIIPFGILLFPPAIPAAPQLDIQPSLPKLPLKEAPIPTLSSHFDIRAPACIDNNSSFRVSGKGLAQRKPVCALVCNKTSQIKTDSRLVDDSQLKCIVKQAPVQGSCRLGARAGGAWLTSKTLRACSVPAEISPGLPQKPALKQPVNKLPAIKPRPVTDTPKQPSGIAPRPRISSGFTPLPSKPKITGLASTPQLASPDGTTRRTDAGLSHTPRVGLAMTGLGDSTTREWLPISITAPLSLTMRGLGNSQTTDYPPINLTVTTPLTMRGVYSGDY